MVLQFKGSFKSKSSPALNFVLFEKPFHLDICHKKEKKRPLKLPFYAKYNDVHLFMCLLV